MVSSHRQPAPSSVTSISAPPAVEITRSPIVTRSAKRKSEQAFVDGDAQPAADITHPAIRKRPRLHHKPEPDTQPGEARIEPKQEPRAAPVLAAGPSNLRRRSAGPPPDATRPRSRLPDLPNVPFLTYPFLPPSLLGPSMMPFSWDLATGLRMPTPAPRAVSSRPASGSGSAPAPRASSSRPAGGSGSASAPRTSSSRPTAGSERAPAPKVIDPAPVFEWTDDDMDDEDDENIDTEEDVAEEEPVRGKGKARAQIREPLRKYVFRGRRFEF